MIAPSPTCTTISAATTQKYLSVARIEGVSASWSSGLLSGAGYGLFALVPLDAPCTTPCAPTPASSTITLTIDQSTMDDPGMLSISGSCGQLLV